MRNNEKSQKRLMASFIVSLNYEVLAVGHKEK